LRRPTVSAEKLWRLLHTEPYVQVLNLGMFDLARAYRDGGMTAFSKLQAAELERGAKEGYHAIKHQRFVGTGYFDQVAQAVASGRASTTALHGSTEQEQFERAGA
jgi:isocitrate lyase